MPRKRKAERNIRSKEPRKRLRCVPILPDEAEKVQKFTTSAVRIAPSVESAIALELGGDVDPDESSKEVLEIEKSLSFSEVTEETKRAIYKECKEMLTGPFMMQIVCAVCDTWTREQLCFLREASKSFYARCRNRLAPSSSLSSDLKRYYDVAAFIPELHDTLISRRGLAKPNGDVNAFQIRVCEPCYSSLMRGKENEICNPPKFSIANGFAIGQLPNELQDVTLTERRLTSLSIIKGHTVVARGGMHKSIKSHILVFSSQPIAIKEGLDEILGNEDKLLLIFTNPMTDPQKKAIMRRYQARRDKIGALLNFYLNHNELYKSLMKTGNDMARLSSIASKSQMDLENVNIIYSTENENISKEIAGDQSNVRRPATFDCATNAEEEILIHPDASLFTSQRAIEDITMFKVAKAQVIDVQQAGELIPASSPSFFGRVYPHLFPFGHGYPDQKRKVSVSMPECVKHYLKLSSRAFAQDETFPLVAFDIVSRTRAMSYIGLTCKLNPKEIEQLDEVSAKDLSDQLDQEARKRQSFKNGHIFIEPVKNRKGKVLLNRVQAVLGKTFATNEERKIYQRKAWNMAAKFHSAAVFITVTPNENGNATVAFFAGSVNKPNLAAIKENDIPGNSARIEISGRDPVACDTFFTNTLDILIEKMIGFDVKTKLPRTNGGLFGVPRAFMGGIESQGKGTLHVHLIVFLAGFPSDSDEIIKRMATDEAFKNRIFSFHTSIISSSALENESDAFCPGCERRGSIKPVQISKRAYANNLRIESPVKTAKCTECGTSFGGDEIVRSCVKFMKKSLIENQCGHLLYPEENIESVEQSERLSSLSEREHDRQIALRAAVPTILPLPDKNASGEELVAHRIYIMELLLLNQSHRWKHAKSCFKKSSNSKVGYCRYNFPRMAQFLIESDDTGRITSNRTIGSEYINSFNEILLQVVRSNHDVRFLLCCAHEIYYTIKYVVKDQNTIDNIAAITLSSYTKKLEKEKNNNVDRTTAQTVYGRIASLAYARSDLIEVGAVTAVHYLMHGTTFLSSHSFQTLHLGRHLNDLNNAENDLGIIPYGSAYIAFNLTSNYTLRPPQLEEECLYDYTEAFYLSPDIPKNIDSNPNCMRLHSKHPFYSKKVVRRRKSRAVADIIGPRIPDLYDISEDDMENYSKIALILFKPHRRSTDILEGFKTFTEAFLNFQQQPVWGESQAKMILSNMQQYYIGKRRAQEMRQAQLEKTDGVDDFSIDSENDVLHEEDLYLSDDDSTVDRTESVPINMETFTSTLKPSTVQHILEIIVHKLDNSINENEMNRNERNARSSESMKRTVRNTIPRHSLQSKTPWTNWPTLKEQKDHPRLSPQEVRATYSRLQLAEKEQECLEIKRMTTTEVIKSEETIVRLLKDAIESKIDSNIEQDHLHSVQHKSILINPSLAQVSKIFTLNKRQNVAFSIAGSYLLDSFIRSILRKPPGKPLRMHMSGEGGTGKSRIIEALRFLAKSWGKPESIVTVAPTGIAAVLINGETVHSRFQIFQNGKPTMKQIEEWSKVYMIIWDEISMTGQTLFAKAFHKIKLYLGTSHGDDPRVHIVTAGDFAQLPPCFEKFVFTAPAHLESSPEVPDFTVDYKSNEEKTTRYSTKTSLKTDNITGFHIWCSFDVVIKLVENMRHHNDPVYGALLNRLRKGVHTDEDFNVLNNRVLDPAFPDMEVHKEFTQQQENDRIAFPVAVQANVSRHSINWLSTVELARISSGEEVPIICPASFNATKRGTKPTLEQMTELLALGDNKLQRLSPLLPIFPGMPVYITQNISPKLGLANGSTGTIVGCQFSDETVFSSINIQDFAMKMASALPEVVYVSVNQKAFTGRFPGVPAQYPISTIPILPHTQTVRVGCLMHRAFSIKMTQMPISPSFAATTHKLQGTTCTAILSYIFNEVGRQPTSLYVLLSRVTNLKGLFLCEKLSSADFKFFRPSREVLEEEDRLDRLSDETLTNYFNRSLFPDEVNKELDLAAKNAIPSSENEDIDLRLPKKSKIKDRFNGDKVKNNIRKRASTFSGQQCQSGSDISAFDTLLSTFNACTVSRLKRCHTMAMLASANNSNTLTFSRILNFNIVPDVKLWTILDVPGDGNCWLYATVLSMYYCSLSQGRILRTEPQICRNNISSLLLNIANLDEETRRNFLRHMNLDTSQRGVLLEQVARCSGYANSLHMMSSLLRIGTPNSCLWAGDTGEELSLLALILNQDIVTFSAPPSQPSLPRDFLMSNIGSLYAGPTYRPYRNVSVEQPCVNFRIPILFRGGNHFQAMIPPTDFNIASL